VLAAAKRLRMVVANVTRTAKSTGEEPVLAAARISRAPALHDPGAIGLEPCLYVGGPDARSVAATLLHLHEALVTR
jgi:predicted fused transcriptional regulator/phosphomethylpyrimidine kinase